MNDNRINFNWHVFGLVFILLKLELFANLTEHIKFI